MISFFRRALSSWVVLGLLGLVMIAFIVTGVGNNGLGGGAGAGDTVADVGGKPVSAAQISQRAEAALKQARAQQPGLDMAGFIRANGGVSALVDQFVSGKLLEVWAGKHGITASDRLVGSEIASIPAFQGPTGKFDQKAMEAVLAQQRLSLRALRDDVASDLVRRQLLTPISAGAQAPLGLATPYARLLIDRREGAIGLVPASTQGIAMPGEGEITAWYASHLARYSLPERRTIRYAAFGPETVTVAAPSEAEIAAAYQADAASYAARETRTLSQVVLPDESAAKAFAARVAGGTAFAKAASDAGFAATDTALGSQTREGFARAASPAAAAAAFALPSGGTTAPVKSELGWHVVHVDAIVSTPARPLAAVHDEIARTLTTKKAQEAVADLSQKIEEAISDGSTFDEVVKTYRLTATISPPVLANGTAPTLPGFSPDATLAALLKAAFDMSPDDEPSVETVGPDQHVALMAIGGILPAAPIPPAQIRPRLVADLIAQRATDRARATARAILARVKAGTPIGAAFAAAGLPAPQPAAASQLQLIEARQQPPAPLRLLFQLPPGKTDIVAAPNGGWFVVRLDRIVPGDSGLLPGIARQMTAEMSRTIGNEYVEQFANAARAEISVRRNPAAIRQLGQQLGGTAPAGP